MSRHGPPIGPYSGQPDPRYEPPSDPWGAAGAWGDPVPAPSGYPPASPPGGARPDQRHLGRGPRQNGALVVLVAMLVLLVAGGTATALYLISGESAPVAGRTASPTEATTTADPAPTEPSGTTPDNTGLAAGLTQVGDCLVNDGDNDVPQMRIVACGSDTEKERFRVLARFEQAVANDAEAQQVCAEVEDYQYHYFFISEQEEQSFVLCLADDD